MGCRWSMSRSLICYHGRCCWPQICKEAHNEHLSKSCLTLLRMDLAQDTSLARPNATAAHACLHSRREGLYQAR